jgi:hypothetical protein
MSLVEVRTALESALATVTPSLPTAQENVEFSPTPGSAYQQVTLLRAQPANIEIGPGYFDQGIFQVNLFFPKNAGPDPAEAQAEKIRAKFPFGGSLSSGGVTVNITGTPEVAPARPDGDYFMLPVKVRWSARIAS